MVSSRIPGFREAVFALLFQSRFFWFFVGNVLEHRRHIVLNADHDFAEETSRLRYQLRILDGA